MPVTLKKKVAVLEGECAVQEAETLYQWLLEHPSGSVNAKTISHIHCAILQVLLYKKPKISVMPVADNMAWFRNLFEDNE